MCTSPVQQCPVQSGRTHAFGMKFEDNKPTKRLSVNSEALFSAISMQNMGQSVVLVIRAPLVKALISQSDSYGRTRCRPPLRVTGCAGHLKSGRAGRLVT